MNKKYKKIHKLQKKYKLQDKKERKEIIKILGLELFLGITTWDEIVKGGEDFNKEYFKVKQKDNKDDENVCPFIK